jgi:hypothetical protein
VHRVLSDITGLSGLRILDAILGGERNPVVLAQLCHSRVRSSPDIIAKSLEGDYRSEHLFALRQSVAGYRYYQGLISEVDEEIQPHLSEFKAASDVASTPPARTKKRPLQRQHYDPTNFDLRSELYRILGVDLTDVPGISAATAHTILCEIGTDVHNFETRRRSPHGWGFVLKDKSAEAASFTHKADAFVTALPSHCVWAPVRCTTSKIILANSSGASAEGLVNPRPLRLLLTRWRASSSTC